jgi:signal transduction histidine kinase
MFSVKKETSCINCRAILDYVKQREPDSLGLLITGLDPEIDGLSNPQAFLRDPNNWVSCAVVSKLMEKAKGILHDEMAAYKIARYAAENVALGYAQGIIVKAFWSIEKGLKSLQAINDKWNRSKQVELIKIGKNEAVVRLHWKPGMHVTKDICVYNQGVYTFMPRIWGGAPLKLEEVCCFFDGAAYCEYHLKWSGRNRLYEVFSRFYTSKSVLMESIMEMETDKKIIEQKYEEVHRLNQELKGKIKQLMAIQDTGKAILSVLDLEQLLAVIMNILFSVCKLNRAVILLINEEKACLEFLHGTGFDSATHTVLQNYSVPLHRVSNMLVRVTSTGRSEYIPSVEASALRKENILLVEGKPTSAFVVPLITRSKVIGVLATDGVEGTGVPEETRETLEVFAPQIAIAIENARLYRSLQERMDDLKRSQALLSRAEKFSFLGNLAARLAHEIKNPLTAIGTFIQLLPQKYEDEEFRNDFYEIAKEETRRVNSLINELLDLVKPRESHFAYGDIEELIKKMILLISPQSKTKNIQVCFDCDETICPVWMDSEKMKQVVLNLLSNAIEFTPRNGRIEINVRRELKEDQSDKIQIEVKDNGIGIPPSDLNRIFEPYFTTKHKSSIHSGTGLGLFIAHQHMQDQGGSIDVRSAINAGTVFVLTLPCAASSEFGREILMKSHAH